MAPRPLALNFLPGVQRDGTKLDSDCALDSLWTRWRLGRPRKMGGYQQITDGLLGIPRRIHMFYRGDRIYVHAGTTASLQQIVLDASGNVLSMADRTPTAFGSGSNVGWTLDAIYDTTSDAVVLVAHSVPDQNAVASATKTVPYLGDITSATPLGQFTDPTATDGTYTQPSVAGGIVCVQPYVFDFDSDGFVGWSAPNLPNYLGIKGGTSGAGNARVSAQKIIAGAPLRGGGANSPAALFWSLSEVISANFIGGTPVFAFNTVSPSSSILSTNSVIEYDGLYLWAGVDRFLLYNGTVVEIPNKYNQDYFFDNLNWAAAAKAFTFKVPRYGEIWFCAPLFGASECNYAAIYNVRENCWYDTVLPNSGRSAGYYAQGFRYPVMGGSERTPNGYRLWMHEKGVDQLIGSTPTAVRSYYQTPYLSGTRGDPPSDAGLSLQQLEPDMVQNGDMNITPTGTWNPRLADSPGDPVNLPANPNVPQEQFASFKYERRLLSVIVESNTIGGNFVTGKNILHVDDAMDKRLTGGMSNPL